MSIVWVKCEVKCESEKTVEKFMAWKSLGIHSTKSTAVKVLGKPQTLKM